MNVCEHNTDGIINEFLKGATRGLREMDELIFFVEFNCVYNQLTLSHGFSSAALRFPNFKQIKRVITSEMKNFLVYFYIDCFFWSESSTPEIL